jgi:hypothetical protein
MRVLILPQFVLVKGRIRSCLRCSKRWCTPRVMRGPSVMIRWSILEFVIFALQVMTVTCPSSNPSANWPLRGKGSPCVESSSLIRGGVMLRTIVVWGDPIRGVVLFIIITIMRKRVRKGMVSLVPVAFSDLLQLMLLWAQ